MITYPNAKINLGLNIVEKRPDGYHNLETIFYPINLQDALEVTKLDDEKEYSLTLSGTPIEGETDDNLVVKAYRLLKADYPDMAPVNIHMFKHIPTGAGLGGGSSDAAFMIKLLNEKFHLNDKLAIGYRAFITPMKDNIEGDWLTESRFYAIVGPRDLKLLLSYDFVRQIAHLDFMFLIGTDSAKINFEKLTTKNMDGGAQKRDFYKNSQRVKIVEPENI